MEGLLAREWLEADGLGGFASGTAAGIRTRRYHALLLTAATPPTGRLVLVNGFDAWVVTAAGRFAISSQAYAPDVTYPEGASRIADFGIEPWPLWTFELPDGTRLAQEILVPKDASAAAVSWRLLAGSKTVTLEVRPFLSGRDSHALHHENPDFRFDTRSSADGRLRFRPYASLPAIAMRTNGAYEHGPEWYRAFLYAEERARGLDFLEDLATPGTFRFDLSSGEAVWLMAAEGHESVLGTGDARGGSRGSAARRADAARRVSRPARARGRRLPRPTRIGADGHRRLSVVHRLGPRHFHRPSRALPRDRAARRGGPDSRRVGGRRVRRDAAQFLPRRKSSARIQLGRRVALVLDCRERVLRGSHGGGKARRRLRTGEAAARFRRDPDRLRTRHALRHSRRVRRPSRRRRPRRAADVDGRKGRRLGRDAPDRQARRDPGPLDQCPEDRRRASPTNSGTCSRRRPTPSSDASGTRPKAASTTSWIRIIVPERRTRRSAPIRSLPSAACPSRS